VTDPTLFAAGALFTQDYLQDGIRNSAAYKAVDVTEVRAALDAIAAGLPHASSPNGPVKPNAPVTKRQIRVRRRPCLDSANQPARSDISIPHLM